VTPKAGNNGLIQPPIMEVEPP